MYYECCLCKCLRKDAILHHFPCTEKRLKKWLHCIDSDDLKKLPAGQLSKLFVCHKHFEKRFITSKSHLTVRAYPSLFTEHEMTSGIPTREFDKNWCTPTEHTYSQTEHCDHSYSRKEPLREPPAIDLQNPTSTNLQGATEHVRYNEYTDEAAYDSWTSYPSTGYKNLPDSLNRPQSTDKPSDADDSMIDADGGIDLNSIDDVEEPTEAVFSWQKEEILYPTEDTDVMCQKEEKYSELKQELGDVSLYEDSPPGARDSNLDKHAEYQCNVCEKKIVGFRYTCVQCADWDLCGACEARAAHAAHYVLRVPSPRPYNEIQAVLAAVRQQLLSENVFLSEQITEDGVKLEPVEAEPDPLQRLSDAEDDQTEGSEPGSPRRKRRRLRSSDSDDSSQADSRDDRHAPRDSAAFSNLTEPLTQFYSIAQNPSATDNNRRIQVSRNKSAPVEPIVIDIGEMEQFDLTGRHRTGHRPGTVQHCNILQPLGYIYKLQSDVFGGSAIEIASHVIESGYIQPGVSESPSKFLQAPDDTIFVEEIDMPTSRDSDVDPIYTGAGGDAASDAAGGERVLYLRVPPGTDDGALAQALQSQAYVVMQPLAITLQESEDTVR